jgi:tetratricopeptide (TPR) repeat protein
MGDTEKSIQNLERSIAMGLGVSKSFDVYARLDDLYARAGRTQGLEQYDEAARRNPKDVVAIFKQGKAHFDNGNNTEAVSKFLGANSLGLRTGESVAYLSVALNQEGAHVRSDGYIAEAISLEPENALIYKLRADILFNRMSFQPAVEDYDTAIRLNPDLAPAYVGRGQVYSQLGLYGLAVEDFTKAISIDPDNSESHGFRGNAYLELGQDQKARKNHGEAARLDPGDLRWLTQLSRSN